MKITKCIKNQKAFSLIEVVIAIVIITIGLVALSGGLVVGVTLPYRSKQQAIAKQLANTVMETVISAKESAKVGFSSFDDFNATPPVASPGVIRRFTGQITAILTTGPDGVYGTCDDGQTGAFNPAASCTGVGTNLVTMDITPGSDGKFSTTGDNKKVQLLGFTRQVQISDIGPATKQIDVTVNYPNATGGRETLTLSTQIANFNVLQ